MAEDPVCLYVQSTDANNFGTKGCTARPPRETRPSPPKWFASRTTPCTSLSNRAVRHLPLGGCEVERPKDETPGCGQDLRSQKCVPGCA
jgi:hypothetical protein